MSHPPWAPWAVILASTLDKAETAIPIVPHVWTLSSGQCVCWFWAFWPYWGQLKPPGASICITVHTVDTKANELLFCNLRISGTQGLVQLQRALWWTLGVLHSKIQKYKNAKMQKYKNTNLQSAKGIGQHLECCIQQLRPPRPRAGLVSVQCTFYKSTIWTIVS